MHFIQKEAIPASIDDLFVAYTEKFANEIAKYSNANGEFVEGETISICSKEIRRAVLFDRAVKKMIRVMDTIDSSAVSEFLRISEESQNELLEKTPRCYYNLKDWLSKEIADFLCVSQLDMEKKTNATYGDKDETSSHLKNDWKKVLKESWEDGLCGVELRKNRPSFAWLALFVQMGFKSTLAFAPPINTRVGDLDGIFSPGIDGHSIAERIKDGGDRSIIQRSVAVFPYTVSQQDCPAAEGYSSMKLKSTCCAPASVDIPNEGKGLWVSKKAEVAFSSKQSRAFPITVEEVNQTLFLLNNYEYITNSPNLDYKKAWEFIFKNRDISTIEALKFLIIKLNLPPALLVQKQQVTEAYANIGKTPVQLKYEK